VTSLAARASRFVDQVFQRAFVESRFLPRKIDGHLEWLSRAQATIASLDDRALFIEPPPAELRAIGHGRYRGLPTQTFSWNLPALIATERFGLGVNTKAPCMTLIGKRQRPIWVLVHGWLGGNRFMDEVFWPLRGLLKTHDVALLSLPGHGARKSPATRLVPTFPSRNPIRNLLGLLTAVTETRQLVAWLRGQGYEDIGIAGTSLGVQVVALLATVENCAKRYLFDRPLAQLNEPLRRRAAVGTAEMRRLEEALLDFYCPVSPLRRPSRVSSTQIDVLLGREDHVAGVEEGERLARHFGVIAQTFPTGHVLSLGREAMVLAILRQLGKSGETFDVSRLHCG
jgi:hypothetical protein